MDVIEAIRQRKSIRGYKPDPVPKKVLQEILAIATRAPSGQNVQPWQFTVVTGKMLDNIRRGNIEMLASGVTSAPDVPGKPRTGVYKQRQVEIAIQLFQLMGIPREDRQKRAEWVQKGARFFDAPAAIIISADRSLAEARAQFDLGLVTQTICLAALNYGLGTCIVLQGVEYPQVVRRFTGIPDSQQIAIGIAIGYPDWDFPANKAHSGREPIDTITTWCGFE